MEVHVSLIFVLNLESSQPRQMEMPLRVLHALNNQEILPLWFLKKKFCSQLLTFPCGPDFLLHKH
jgi:hypothetical protein